jgi:hypothetical protein
MFRLFQVSLAGLAMIAQIAIAQVAAYDRFNLRDIYIIAITDSDSLSVGSHLVINFPDTGESQTVEIVQLSSLGQDIELDLYFAAQNLHYIVEVSRDGISTLFR